MGKTVRVTDSRGRDLEGEPRVFDQDGEERYELVNVTERRGAPYDDTIHHDAVGVTAKDLGLN